MFAGPSIGLPYPQSPYPGTINGVSSQVWSNIFPLVGGEIWTVPPGNWSISCTQGLAQVQFLDPVSTLWRPIKAAAQYKLLNSDGNNYRVANLTGCPVGAIVTNVGSGYVQSSTTVSVSAGGSLWTPIIGGAVNTSVTIGNDSKGNAGGTNFTYAPLLVVQAPPPGGVQATMTCTVSAGAINAVTVTNQGAGYTQAPGILVIPNPLDPALGLITIPTLTATLTGAGELAALLCTNPGTPLTSVPTLTIAGAGSNAAATVVMCFTVTGATVGAGSGYGTGAAGIIATAGGVVTAAAGAIVNPAISTAMFIPRQAQISAPISGGALGTPVVVDGGLFQAAPSPVLLVPPTSAAPTPGTNPALTMGSATDTILVQNLGSGA